jgi:hypothetical protein
VPPGKDQLSSKPSVVFPTLLHDTCRLAANLPTQQTGIQPPP